MLHQADILFQNCSAPGPSLFDCILPIMIGTKDQLMATVESEDLMTRNFGPASNRMLISKVVEQMDPHGDSTTLWLHDYDKSLAFPLFIGVVSANSSRHNSPCRPDQITSLVKKAFNTKVTGESSMFTIFIYLAVEKPHAFAAGCAVSRAFHLYSTKKSAKTVIAVSVFFVPPQFVQIEAAELKRISETAKSIKHAGKLIDMPTSELDTTKFVDEANSVYQSLIKDGTNDVTIKIVQGVELKEKGFGGLWGVGKAATQPPALVVLSYKHKTAQKVPTVAWVGKGIVYDSGGLSIKSTDSMCGMKRDMSGAAAVLTAFRAAVVNNAPVNIHAILCLAENAVGPESQRNDDIVYMYSGKTVEINNTDAEGRLVLGDGVAYASKHLECDIIVDIATLTGAQGISTGRKHAAIVCNNEDFEAKAVAAGKSSGDLVHPLIYCPEFFLSEFKSVVADMKNSVKDRSNSPSSCAGHFIASHLDPSFKGIWLHIDMAAPAYNEERGTGYGVALLMDLFAR